MYVLTLNLTDGVDDVQVTNLTEATTGCLHDYQITTSNMISLSHADALIINGDGMENFIEKAINTYPDLKIINASEGIRESHEELLEDEHEEHEEHEEHDEEHHHDHGENSHYWVSVSLYIEQVKNVERELIKLDPANEEKYKTNTEEYINKLEALKDKMHQALDGLENKKVVTFHEAFLYFAEEFDLDIVAVIEREPGTYPSAREVAETIDLIKEKDVKAIFSEPQYSKSAADTIAREAGINVYSLDPIVTGKLYKDAYIDLMEENLNTLVDALS
jgi:zinc transport system substrate-binding protein